MKSRRILKLFMRLGAKEWHSKTNTPPPPPPPRRGGGKSPFPWGGGGGGVDLSPLLDLILEKVPEASKNESGKMSAQVFNLGYDNFLGRMAVARIYSGKI